MFVNGAILNIVVSPILIDMNYHGQMDGHDNYSDSVCFHFIENPEE